MGGGWVGGGGMGGGGWAAAVWAAAAWAAAVWAAAAWAAAEAAGLAGMVIINRVTVPGPRQVLLHVKIAEINRTATRSIGVSWLYARGKSILGSAAGNNATMSTTTTAAYTQTYRTSGFVKPVAGNLQRDRARPRRPEPRRFSACSTRGTSRCSSTPFAPTRLAKILAEPNLVALDGQPARFLVGGLFPFPVPQSSSIPGGTAVVTVQFQRFGTILTFLPEILPNDVIRLDVEPVISQLNFAQGTTVDGGIVPSITSEARARSSSCGRGKRWRSRDCSSRSPTPRRSRIPGLGDLPIVGPWFSANTIETIETETIVLVTPELVSPLDKKEVTEAPGDRVYQPNDAEFYFLGRIEGKLGREFRATKAEQDPLNLMKHFQSEQQWVIGPHGHAD